MPNTTENNLGSREKVYEREREIGEANRSYDGIFLFHYLLRHLLVASLVIDVKPVVVVDDDDVKPVVVVDVEPVVVGVVVEPVVVGVDVEPVVVVDVKPIVVVDVKPTVVELLLSLYHGSC